jgi:hypothetical protein
MNDCFRLVPFHLMRNAVCLLLMLLCTALQDDQAVIKARTSSNGSNDKQDLHPAPDKQQQQHEQQAAQPEQEQHVAEQQIEQRQVPRLIMRTCFFDDAALAAVGAPPERALRCLQPLLQHVAQQGVPSCKQVGTGMVG